MALAEKRTLRHGELGEHQGLNGLAVFKNNRKDMVVSIKWASCPAQHRFQEDFSIEQSSHYKP